MASWRQSQVRRPGGRRRSHARRFTVVARFLHCATLCAPFAHFSSSAFPAKAHTASIKLDICSLPKATPLVTTACLATQTLAFACETKPVTRQARTCPGRDLSHSSLTAVGFEPTPLRTGAWSQRLRPLGQTVMWSTLEDGRCLHRASS